MISLSLSLGHLLNKMCDTTCTKDGQVTKLKKNYRETNLKVHCVMQLSLSYNMASPKYQVIAIKLASNPC